MPRDLTKERAAYSCMADACSQGRRKCPVPQACERAEPKTVTEALWFVLPFIVVVSAAVWLFAASMS